MDTEINTHLGVSDSIKGVQCATIHDLMSEFFFMSDSEAPGPRDAEVPEQPRVRSFYERTRGRRFIRSTLTAPSLPCYNRPAKSPSESKTSHYITQDVAARRSLFLGNRRAAPRANSRSNPCSSQKDTAPAPWRIRQDIGALLDGRRSRSAGPRRSSSWGTPPGRGVGLCANQGVRTSRQ